MSGDAALLQPASLLKDAKYVRRTCGMEAGLVSELRQAMASADASQAQELCDRIVARINEQTNEANRAAVIAPPVGSLYASAVCGDEPPTVVIWLLLDPTDIDSKQTTFVLRSPKAERTFQQLYKFSLDAALVSHAALPSVAEDGDFVASPAAEDGDAVAPLSPALLLNDARYERRTCGMKTSLVSELRRAMASANALGAQELCDKILAKMSEANRAAVIAPPVGPLYASAACGDEPPTVVIWLLLDPTDIDSKQTTFVLRSPKAERTFQQLYKISLDTDIVSRDALPSVTEDGDDNGDLVAA